MKEFHLDFSVRKISQIVPEFKKALAVAAAKSVYLKNLHPQFLRDLTQAFTEGAANAFRHADEVKRKGKVSCSLTLTPKGVQIDILDHGPGFKPEKVPLPSLTDFSDHGRGLFLMRQLMDQVSYKKGFRENCLTLRREFPPANADAIDLLYEISDALLQGASPEQLSRRLLDRTVEVFDVDRASIMIYDESQKKLRVTASRGLSPKHREGLIRPGEGIAGYVFSHAKPCLIEDMEKNKAGWLSRKRYRSRSFIAAPIILEARGQQARSVGVINLTDRRDGKPFTRKDLRVLCTIANQLAAYLHISRLLKEASDTEGLRRELDIARRIQQSYLPQKAFLVPGFEMSGHLRTTQKVGGDYYDFIQPDPSHFYVVVADVSGHNVGAALTMANFRSQLRSILLGERNPGRVIEKLGMELYSDLAENDQFVSLLLARFLPEEKRVELSIAGHRAPLLIRQGRAAPVTLPSRAGLVLGIRPETVYETVSFPFSCGDLFFFYTDGVIEMTNRRKERFGVDRLVAELEKLWQEPPSDLLAKLADRVDRFRGALPLTDDATAVALRVIS